MAERLVAVANDAVLIIEKIENRVRLVTSWRDGLSADTWHPTVGDAREEARNRWGSKLSLWRSLPDEVADPVTFAFAQESHTTRLVRHGRIITEKGIATGPEQLFNPSGSSGMDLYKYYGGKTKERVAQPKASSGNPSEPNAESDEAK